MENTKTKFFGKQEGERILHFVQPHPLAIKFKLIKVYLAAVVILGGFILVGTLTDSMFGIFFLFGLVATVATIIVGSLIVKISRRKNKTYFTDRRIVRFEPTTLFATNIRSLSWDEVVKVKTYPPNVFLKQRKIGTVVIHARTTVRTVDDEMKPSTVTADDIEITDVYYYRDLGNYIDKILYTYKRKPKDVKKIKPFVEKPAGQRD